MSNPFDSAVEALRTAEPRPEAVDRAVATLRRPHPPRLVPLAVGVAAVSAAFLWPRPGNGLAWAQIAAQDLPLRFHERTVRIRAGKEVFEYENWIDRPGDAYRNRFYLPDRPLRPNEDPASVPSHDHGYIESPNGWYMLNADMAVYSRKPHERSKWDPRSEKNVRDKTGLEKLMRNEAIHQLGVEEDVMTRVGKADRYRLDSPIYDGYGSRHEKGRHPFVVYVQPGTKRILGADSVQPNGSLWQTTIEYPDRFPAHTFALPRGTPVPTFDLDALDRRIAERLETPLASLKAGNQTSKLRLVLQGVHKELYVLWSGAKPNGDLAHFVRVLGMPNGTRYGLAAFTAKGDRERSSPYGGHAINLDRRVMAVDLQVPVFAPGPGPGRSRFVGDVTIRKIPVIQVPEVTALSAVAPERKSRRPIQIGAVASPPRVRGRG